MNYMTVSEARSEIPTLSESATSTVLMRNSQPVAVLMPIREYRAMRAMLKLAARPEAAARVLAAHGRVQRGDLEGFVEMESEHEVAPVRQGSI
jgi:PHD/YefM family antitoxin component YafN of YafNO toxin-antitoxin module